MIELQFVSCDQRTSTNQEAMPHRHQYTLETVMGDLSNKIPASTIFVMTTSGLVVGHSGSMPAIEINTLGALVSGMFSAAEKIHDLLGDNEIPVLSHHTTGQSLFAFGLPDSSGVLTIVGKMRALNADQINAIRKANLYLKDILPHENDSWSESEDSPKSSRDKSAERRINPRISQGVDEESDELQLEADLFHSD